MNFQAVIEGTSGIEQVITEFPQLNGIITKIGVHNRGVMCTSFSGDINFNSNCFSSYKKAFEACSSNNGYHPKNSSVSLAAAHEAGHLLEKILIEQDITDFDEKISAWNKSLYAESIVDYAIRNIRQTEYGKNKSELELITNISYYARENKSECLAEAVGDYIINRENASLLSLEIIKVLRGELK